MATAPILIRYAQIEASSLVIAAARVTQAAVVLDGVILVVGWAGPSRTD